MKQCGYNLKALCWRNAVRQKRAYIVFFVNLYEDLKVTKTIYIERKVNLCLRQVVSELTAKPKKGALWNDESILNIDLADGYVIG